MSDKVQSVERKKDYGVLKERLQAGETMKDAMLAAGWPPSQANRGKAGLGATALRRLLKSKVDLGRSITPEEQEQFVRGRLIENGLTGKDAGVQSLKLLGQDRRVNMFTADNQVGVIVIGELPKTMEALANEALPENTIAGELPETSKL